MTTPGTGRKITSATDGVTTTFACPVFRRESELFVYLLPTATALDSQGVLLVQDVHYTMTGDGPSGTAQIHTIGAYGGGQYIRRTRKTSRAQENDYVPNDGFPADSHEAALDRLSMVDEELDDNIATVQLDINTRTLRVPVGESVQEFPPRAGRPRTFVGFDQAGGLMLWEFADVRELIPKGETGAPGSGNLVGFYVDDYCTVNTAAGNTAGFEALAAAVNAAGGGVIDWTPGKWYVVGAQDDHAAAPVNLDGSPGGNVRYLPKPLLELIDCKGLILNINGAKMIAADGLRHGAFNADGTPMASPNGYQGVGYSGAYDKMIKLTNCDDFVIRDGEFDGNSNLLYKGGPWGDSGYQLRGYGLWLTDCTRYLIYNIFTHHHPEDGLVIEGAAVTDDSESEHGMVLNLLSELNGRQGMSLIGGRGITFKNCGFNFSGKNSKFDATIAHPFNSAPGEGVDIEPSFGKIVRDISFEDCRFICCWQGSMAADQGDAKHVSFTRCTFIADRSFAVWPKKPFFKFVDCTIVGQVVNPWPSANPAEATQFIRCNFYDDAGMVPTGIAPFFQGPTSPETVADMGGLGAQNVMFDQCNFILTGPAAGPFGTATIKNCYLTQARSDKNTYLQGARFEGRNIFTFVAPAVLADSFSTYTGHTIVNGVYKGVSAELADEQGLRIESNDAIGVTANRIGYWYNPTAWAAQVPGGAVVSDLVLNTRHTYGEAAFAWQCIMAPGNLDAHWRPVLQMVANGFSGGAYSSGADLATLTLDFNTLCNQLRDAGLKKI